MARASAALGVLSCLAGPALSAITVPGDFPSLQAVADWQRQQESFIDTVRVLPTVPFEPATFWTYAPSHLIGQPDSSGVLPTIGRLELFDVGAMRVQSLHVAGPARYAWGNYVFQRCEIESTVVWLGQSDPGSLVLRSCTLNGHPAVDAMQSVVVDSCQVNGEIIVRSAADGSLFVYASVFTGPGAWAIDASVTSGSEVAGNTIRGFTNGIFVRPDGYALQVRDNLIEDCSGTGIMAYPSGNGVEVVGNVIRRCGIGIDVQQVDALVRNNLVLDCSGDGIRVEPDIRAEIERNIVARSGGNGFVVAASPYGEAAVRNNTSSGNAASGFALYGAVVFNHNISHANHGYGVWADSLGPPVTGCNDGFANEAGSARGLVLAATDLEVEPGFCGVAESDFHVASGSPLLNGAGCGLIGALGLGCAVTPVGVQGAGAPTSTLLRATPNPSHGPVTIEFALGREERVEVDVFDVLGRRVVALVHAVLPAGAHVVRWPGQERDGPSVSGLYFVRLRRSGGDRWVRLVRAL